MNFRKIPIAGVALLTVASLAGQTAILPWANHIEVAAGVRTVITKWRVIVAIIAVSAVMSLPRIDLR